MDEPTVAPGTFRFPKAHRLRKRFEFLRVQGRGHRVFGRQFIFHFLRGRGHASRLGITVSKKVGNAVVRNRIKRWVREAWRQHPALHPAPTAERPAFDLVVTARRGVDHFSFQSIRDELLHVIQRYLDKPPPKGARRRRRRGPRRG